VFASFDRVFHICIETNFVLNYEKCHFMSEEVVLGHLISDGDIQVDRAKINVITSLPYSSTMREICSLLGHASFYRRFI